MDQVAPLSSAEGRHLESELAHPLPPNRLLLLLRALSRGGTSNQNSFAPSSHPPPPSCSAEGLHFDAFCRVNCVDGGL